LIRNLNREGARRPSGKTPLISPAVALALLILIVAIVLLWR
jgi:hypothetical protein